MQPKNVKHKKSIFGKDEVTYDCPHCGESLRSSLSEAGSSDHCPNCEGTFVVPGLEIIESIEEAKRANELIKEQERLEDEKYRAAQEDKIKQQCEKEKVETAEREKRYKEQVAHEKRIQDAAEKEQLERDPINHISAGLMHLVSIMITSLWLVLCSSLLPVFQLLDKESAGFFSLIDCCVMIYLIYLQIDHLSSAKEAFLRGSKKKN